MTILKVYSHPRSGTCWMNMLLMQAFLGHARTERAKTGHWSVPISAIMPEKTLWGGHPFYRPNLPGPRIYLYRDGRDVALSWWRTKAFQHKKDRGLSFSEFLRTPLDWWLSPRRRATSGLTFVEYWLRHLSSWHQAPDTHFVRYESLLLHTEAELASIAAFIGQKLLVGARATEGAGPFPSGDYRTRKWESAFSDDDLTYFFEIVPRDFWGLWEGENGDSSLS